MPVCSCIHCLNVSVVQVFVQHSWSLLFLCSENVKIYGNVSHFAAVKIQCGILIQNSFSCDVVCIMLAVKLCFLKLR